MGIKNNFWGDIQIKKTIQTFNFQRKNGEIICFILKYDIFVIFDVHIYSPFGFLFDLILMYY